MTTYTTRLLELCDENDIYHTCSGIPGSWASCLRCNIIQASVSADAQLRLRGLPEAFK